MQAAGVELIEHVGQLAVMGFIEVLEHVPKYCALLRASTARIESGSVALVVLIDYPAFNMRVADGRAAAGVPVLYYITPQVWASRAERLARLARTVTKAAVILPFEEPLLRPHGIDATFVGHPLLDRLATVPDRARRAQASASSDDDRVLALFPGSREQEIDRHLDAIRRDGARAAAARSRRSKSWSARRTAHRARLRADVRSRWFVRRRSRFSAPPTRRCARAARRRSRRRWPGARSSSRIDPSRSTTPWRGGW